ncbi:MAG: Dyp-type peroxidase [Nocardioides sp.]|uniref:Dyp-type peroxidase n=1 Tax=Nocardioides sp. TaxID=35761 RepID=UPI003F0113DB
MTEQDLDRTPPSTSPRPPAGPAVGRRGLIGYVGSAVVGAGVGAATGAAVASATASDEVVQRVGETLSPYGRHQAGVTAPMQACSETVALDLLPAVARAADRDALARMLRVLTGDIEAFMLGRGAPGDPTPWLSSAGADVAVTLGLGHTFFTDAWGLPAPGGFEPVPPMEHDRLQERWSGGDLVLVVGGRDATTVGHVVRRLVADVAPFATLRWRQQGSWNGFGADGGRVTGRNLFGQVDGSANPAPGTDLFDRTVWINGGAWQHGTTLVVRRIRMDLPTWDGLTRAEQEQSVGRDLATGAPLTGGAELDDVDLQARRDGAYVVAAGSHVRRSHPDLNGGRRIFRKGANYEVLTEEGSEAGLVFASYQANLSGQFTPLQQAIDAEDLLNEWTTAIGSAEFAVLPGFEKGGWLGQSLLGDS